MLSRAAQEAPTVGPGRFTMAVLWERSAAKRQALESVSHLTASVCAVDPARSARGAPPSHPTSPLKA